jgi:hypothetical protein
MDDAHYRRLARSVGPEKTEALPFDDGKADPVDSPESIIILDQIFGGNDLHGKLIIKIAERWERRNRLETENRLWVMGYGKGRKNETFATVPIAYYPSPITSLLSVPVLHPEVAFRIAPPYGTLGAGYHARAAFKASCVFDDYLIVLLIEGVQMPRTDGQAVPDGAFRSADIVVYEDVALPVRLEGVKGKLFVYLHGLSPQMFLMR